MIEEKPNARLGDLAELAKETWDQKSIFSDQFPYIEISGIDTSTGQLMPIPNIPVNKAPSRAKMIVRGGDILVSMTRPNRAAIAEITPEQDGSIASTGFAVLRDMKTDRISKDYLFAILRTRLSLDQMEQRATGGNYPAITTDDLKNIKIVTPEQAKQKKIVSHIRTNYEKVQLLRHEAERIIKKAQQKTTDMILA